MRPIFCGNFPYDMRPGEIERMFDRYGKVDRVDMKQGFAFVYMVDERDGDDAVRRLNDRDVDGRRLKVEWAKGDGSVRRREEDRKRNMTPTTTLFVVNFDARLTREGDLERHFGPYGALTRVQIKKNFAFVQFETVAMATKALEACHLSSMDGRVISVEYVAREDNRDGGGAGGGGGGGYGGRSGGGGGGGGFGRDRGGDRGSYGRGRSRSRSPPRRRSPSPYGRDRYRRASPPPEARRGASPDGRRGASPDRRGASPDRRSPPAAAAPPAAAGDGAWARRNSPSPPPK